MDWDVEKMNWIGNLEDVIGRRSRPCMMN